MKAPIQWMNLKKISRSALAFLCLSFLTATTSFAGPLINGSFETGLSPWTFYLSGGATGTQYDDNSTKADGSWSEAFQIWHAVPGCAWCAQLQQGGLTISAGSLVTVSFQAKAQSARSIEAGMQQLSSPYNWYSLNSFNVTTSWAPYSFSFTPGTSDTNAALNFNFGELASNVWIDKVTFTVTAPPTVSISATPTSIIRGDSSTLAYSSANATSCAGTNFTASGTSGSVAVTPLTTTTYSVTCTGAAGSASASATVTVGNLAPPSGYSSGQLIFEDTFTSGSLNTAKWNPWMGDDNFGRWGNQGTLASPYSGLDAGGNTLNYLDPYPYGYATNTTGSHLTGGNGILKISASPSSYFSGLGYSWSSSGVSSFGKTYLPATGGYVQFRAKMPDSRYGAWAGIWFMPDANSDGHEFDLQESGFYASGASNANYVLASHWWGGAATQVVQNTGVDLSAGYHTYGVEYRPGTSWKVYLDGTLMATWTSGVSSTAKYELIMDLDMASSQTSGWHTVSDATNHPGPFELSVSNAQIYELP